MTQWRQKDDLPATAVRISSFILLFVAVTCFLFIVAVSFNDTFSAIRKWECIVLRACKNFKVSNEHLFIYVVPYYYYLSPVHWFSW